ncbi:hypothetical protein D3C72_2127240 [compost metagenome]
MQRQVVGDLGAALGADELVQPDRKLAFVGIAKCLEQKLGNTKPQHPVSKEFEPLIVRSLGIAGAGMGQRPIEPFLLAELIANHGLELGPILRA